MQIYPAILTDSLQTAQQQLDLVKESGLFETVQVDIIDGYFADAITLTPADLAECDWGELTVDIHLMTVDPLDFVHELIEFKQQIPIRSVITQVEKLSAQAAFITEVQHQDWQVGFSLDLYNTLEAIEPELLPKLDIVQVMGNFAGSQGLPLHERALVTVREVSTMHSDRGYEWEVLCDIGVNPATIASIAAAGATGAAVGSALWTASDFMQIAQQLVGVEET